MNHTYRIVWNHVFACYQVVSETAKGGGKSGKSLSTLLGGALLLAGTTVLAGPQGGQVTAGTATITQSGTITTINQSSGKAAIDWTRFSVGANETVRFNQPNASSITLNRVTGTESSAIMGNLSANGQIFILNPNGVLFGAGSQVNVGGLVASTLRLDNASFMAGNYRFSGAGNSSVVNNGSIKVEPGGTIALMAPVVQNTGSLQAPGGHVLLAGAQGVTLSLQSDGGLIAYTLDAGSAKALVDNGGLIEAGGGHVVLTAKGVDALSTAVVNHSGVIEAQTVSNKGGAIELLGDMQSGSVNVSGKLDASAPTSGNGGFVETSAAQVHIADTAQVTTRASAGATGKWLIDPTDFTISAGTTTQSASGIGAITLSQNLANTDVAIATAPTGTGNGDIFVNSAVSWVANKLTLSAHRNININANLNASGIAQLALEYGQATANGSGASYYVAQGAKVNLPSGQNFSTKQGTAGALKTFTVINALGAAGSTTGSDLQGVNGNLARNYVLGSDIDASTTTGWNAGRGFDSIGKASAYTGEFDGLGHTISNLSINRSDSVVGLFGVMSGAVRNLGVVNANVVGAGHAGILAGTLPGSVTRSYSTGSVRNSSSIGSVGGLIGSVGVPGAVSQSFQLRM